jgi:hypothetical protein
MGRSVAKIVVKEALTAGHQVFTTIFTIATSYPPSPTVVACEADTILGSAMMGPNRPGRGAHVATASFTVEPGTRDEASALSLASTPSMGRVQRNSRPSSSTPLSKPT